MQPPPVLSTKDKWTPINQQPLLIGSGRVGHLILRALAFRASDPQNALAWTSFYSPKSLPPVPQYWSQAAFGAFSFFFSSTTLETPEIYFHIFFFILYAISLWETTQWSEIWESTRKQLLATTSRMWQTEDYFFNEKFYFKTLNPKKTQWKHLLYNLFQIDFLLMNLREIAAVCEQMCLFFSGAVFLTLSPWSPMAR